MKDIIKLLGWDKETKRPIYRSIFFNFCIFISIVLFYNSLFVQEVYMDDWGYYSIYIIKTCIVCIIMILFNYIWGYYELLSRVDKLENNLPKSDNKDL
jgi:phosphoglycerol transferase MdoB-like AlkP superfamily enzyme